jgi:hypothetical protein
MKTRPGLDLDEEAVSPIGSTSVYVFAPIID